MLDEGIFDVDANTSIDQLSEDLNIKMPEDHQYETVSGFVCENFGYIPKIGEIIEVPLERKNEDDNDAPIADHQDQKETFKLEILAGNSRKVTAVQFTRINGGHEMLENKEVTRKPTKFMKRKWSRRRHQVCKKCIYRDF
ncbi:DUF21 domain-containing protein At1g55930, chloroplastic-like [Lotus japonicus]|uniref:DUF21 domain-containing protein At1g55930, chloroplastic-like n=1 Tax=Lotus japonicus TaxID=34305 RepID=UPI00258A4B68|nr:DUF21 domain-containing protein At1g55930, chloroplastic-like [Lotus japonicus]